MPRPEKVQAVAEIKQRLEEAEAVFVAEYAGLSVGEQQQLRRGLTAAEGEFRIVKMTLARRAASELGHDGLLDLLVGPTGLAFATGDAAAAAKALRDFSKDHEHLVIKGALLGAEVLPPERVTQLADIEPRDVLLAKIAGAFQAPMAAMAGLIAAMPRNMATMIQQLIDKAPAEMADAEETVEQPAEAETAAGPEAEETAEAEEPAEETAGPEAEETAEAEEPAEDTAGPEAEGATEATDQTADATTEEAAEAAADAEAEATTDDDDAADTAKEE